MHWISWRAGMIEPSLDDLWDRPIASIETFDFSDALTNVAINQTELWTTALLDEYLAGPKSFVHGTKMEFQGFLNPEDRQAIIQYLERSG